MISGSDCFFRSGLHIALVTLASPHPPQMPFSNKTIKSDLVAKTRTCTASAEAKPAAEHVLRRPAASSSTSAIHNPSEPVVWNGPYLGLPKTANMVYINRLIGRWPMRMMVYPSGEVIEFTNRMNQGLPMIEPIDPSAKSGRVWEVCRCRWPMSWLSTPCSGETTSNLPMPQIHACNTFISPTTYLSPSGP
jgi:hypothetical protein